MIVLVMGRHEVGWGQNCHDDDHDDHNQAHDHQHKVIEFIMIIQKVLVMGRHEVGWGQGRSFCLDILSFPRVTNHICYLAFLFRYIYAYHLK